MIHLSAKNEDQVIFMPEGSEEWLEGEVIAIERSKQAIPESVAQPIDRMIRTVLESYIFTIRVMQDFDQHLSMCESLRSWILGDGFIRTIPVKLEGHYKVNYRRIKFATEGYSNARNWQTMEALDPQEWIRNCGQSLLSRFDTSPFGDEIKKLLASGALSRQLDAEEVGRLSFAAKGYRMAEKPKSKEQVIAEYLKRSEENRPIIEAANRKWWTEVRKEPYPESFTPMAKRPTQSTESKTINVLPAEGWSHLPELTIKEQKEGNPKTESKL